MLRRAKQDTGKPDTDVAAMGAIGELMADLTLEVRGRIARVINEVTPGLASQDRNALIDALVKDRIEWATSDFAGKIMTFSDAFEDVTGKGAGR